MCVFVFEYYSYFTVGLLFRSNTLCIKHCRLGYKYIYYVLNTKAYHGTHIPKQPRSRPFTEFSLSSTF